MVKVVFRTDGGTVIEAAAPVGTSVMRAALNAGVPGIKGDCGGACSCATCHVLVLGRWLEVTGAASETEHDMIEFEAEPAPNSRLCCQIELTDELDGLELQVPA